MSAEKMERLLKTIKELPDSQFLPITALSALKLMSAYKITDITALHTQFGDKVKLALTAMDGTKLEIFSPRMYCDFFLNEKDEILKFNLQLIVTEFKGKVPTLELQAPKSTLKKRKLGADASNDLMNEDAPAKASKKTKV